MGSEKREKIVLGDRDYNIEYNSLCDNVRYHINRVNTSEVIDEEGFEELEKTNDSVMKKQKDLRKQASSILDDAIEAINKEMKGEAGDKAREEARELYRNRIRNLDDVIHNIKTARKEIKEQRSVQQGTTLSERFSQLGSTKGWMFVAKVANALINAIKRCFPGAEVKAEYRERVFKAATMSHTAKAAGADAENTFRTSSELSNLKRSLVAQLETKKSIELVGLDTKVTKCQKEIDGMDLEIKSKVKKYEAAVANHAKLSKPLVKMIHETTERDDLNSKVLTLDSEIKVLREEIAAGRILMKDKTVELTEHRGNVSKCQEEIRELSKIISDLEKEIDRGASVTGQSAMRKKLHALQEEAKGAAAKSDEPSPPRGMPK